MILVLADDFSGAAEMAGIARYLGCSAEVQTTLKESSDSQVVALDTGTRGLSRQGAVDALKGMIPQINRMQASWVFKKVDSVLRGHVLPETETIMQGLDLRCGLIISANPSKNRVIRDGLYFIGDQPLHQTLFARDPVFPAMSSKVMELLGPADRVMVRKVSTRMQMDHESGLLVPDVVSGEDVCFWAKQVSHQVLAVGGVDFFSALLKLRTEMGQGHAGSHSSKLPISKLLVCGSLAAVESGRYLKCLKRGWPVHTLPVEWLMSEDSQLPIAWCDQVMGDIHRSGRCLVGVGSTLPKVTHDASHPARRLVQAVNQLCKESPIDQILVEGGETAFFLMQSLKKDRFKVLHSSSEWIPELVPFGCEGPRIVPKPGSYHWPDEFLDD